MLINGAPLNSGPLAGGIGGQGAEPVYVVAGQAFTWRVRLMVGGEDLTDQLTGVIDVDREEGAAGVAGFSLWLPPGPVVPMDWEGKSVTIDYISRDRNGQITEQRLYTGRMELPTWSPASRLLACDCSDGLQQRIEAMSLQAVDALIGGYWSADVFEALDGRSRWDYASERLSTIPASLDCSPSGDLRVTSWFAATSPHFVFGEGTTLDGSLQIDLAPHSAVVNYVEIELSYRYSRLWQHNTQWSWSHPEYGSSGIQGFCQWRVWTSDLPTTDMIESAVSSSGAQLVGRVGGFKLPLTMPNPCGDGQAWINTFDNLWLSATFTTAQRWVQTVTEKYTLTLMTPAGEVEATRVVERDSVSFEIESDRVDEWEDSKPAPSSTIEDVNDEARRQAALACVLNQALTRLIDAHRSTTVSFEVPADMALGVDLLHTLQLDDKMKAKGKCRRIQHRLDIAAGTAITTLSIAVMHGGGGNSDPLTIPAGPDTSLPPLSATGAPLPTQLGGRIRHPVTGLTIPPYDDERLGFSGNWDAADDLGAERFPRRFDIETIEIPAEYRDELVAERSASWLVGIPNDQLEL